MKRSTLAFGALVALLLLTGVTWAVSDGSAATIAAVAAVKIAVIGVVFLELDRSWPGWAAISALVVAGVLGGALMLMPA